MSKCPVYTSRLEENLTYAKEMNTLRFLKSAVLNTFKEIELYINNTNRNDRFCIVEYGELTMVNFFVISIIRQDTENRYLILNEAELVDRKEKYAGSWRNERYGELIQARGSSQGLEGRI